MSVATKRIKSIAIPDFDIKDPSLVLYLPLHYPYSDMTGSTIYSYDRYRHSCAVTGAVWTPQGRTFDGVDDNINCGDITQLNSVPNFTILMWFKQPTIDVTNVLFGKVKDASNSIGWNTLATGDMTFNLRNADVPMTGAAYFDYSTAVTAGKFCQLAVVFDGTLTGSANRFKVFIDAAQQTLTFVGTAIPATTANLSGFDSVISRSTTAFSGTIGEFILYSNSLTPAEIQRTI